MLRRGVYPYEYVHDLEKPNETSLPEKQYFYCNLRMKDITDIDCMYAKVDCKDFEIKFLGDYHDLYAQSDTLLLADLLNNFRNIFLEIYELDPAHFLSV